MFKNLFKNFKCNNQRRADALLRAGQDIFNKKEPDKFRGCEIRLVVKKFLEYINKNSDKFYYDDRLPFPADRYVGTSGITDGKYIATLYLIWENTFGNDKASTTLNPLESNCISMQLDFFKKKWENNLNLKQKEREQKLLESLS